jgi:hypothetical protein
MASVRTAMNASGSEGLPSETARGLNQSLHGYLESTRVGTGLAAWRTRSVAASSFPFSGSTGTPSCSRKICLNQTRHVSPLAPSFKRAHACNVSDLHYQAHALVTALKRNKRADLTGVLWCGSTPIERRSTEF